MAPVEVELDVEVVGDLQSGLFEGGKSAAAGQQFRFKRAPACLSLRVIVGVARPAIAGQCLSFFNAQMAAELG